MACLARVKARHIARVALSKGGPRAKSYSKGGPRVRVGLIARVVLRARLIAKPY
jgi:hypothetical protein